MTNVQILKADFNITDPEWPRYAIWRTLTSDDFSGTGAIVGAPTTAALGGEPMTWQGIAEGWTRHDGGIRTPQSNFEDAIYLANLPQDISLSYTVKKMPTANLDRLMFSVRANASRTERVVLAFFANGDLQLETRSASGRVVSPVVPAGGKVGDRVEVEAVGSTVTAKINGVVKITFKTTVVRPGDVVLMTYPVTDAVIDDLVVVGRG